MVKIRVLIIGGTGFVGRNITEYLLEHGYDIRVLVRNDSKIGNLEEKGVKLVYGDLLKEETLEVATKDIDVVIHAGGILGGYGVAREMLNQVHVQGTRNLLEASNKNNVKRVIVISSIAAAGPTDSIGNEQTIPSPKTEYDKAKNEQENLVRRYCEGIDMEYIIIRAGYVYGPYETRKKLKLFKLIQKGMFFIIGKGKNVISFVYTENLAHGVQLAIESESKNSTYIIADDNPYEMEEFIEEIVKQLDAKKPIHVPKPIAYIGSIALESLSLLTRKEPLLTRERVNNLTSSFEFSIEKAKSELGYKPKFGLTEGIERTKDWYRKNGMIK